jgi:phage shock protein PspC (stress-responsive transcriptional regulator)
MDDIRETFRRQGLTRPRGNRVLGGVCSGVGRRLGLDPWPARLLFVLVLLVIPGSQLLVYPILWVLMPSEEWTPAATAGGSSVAASDAPTSGPQHP